VLASGHIAPGWPLNGVPTSDVWGLRYEFEIISDDAGGVYLAWSDVAVGGYDVFVQRITGEGAIAPAWPPGGVRISFRPTTDRFAQLCLDGAGGVFVVWQDERKNDPYDPDIYLQRLNGDGTRASGWPPDGLPIAASSLVEILPSLLADGVGGAFIGFARGSPTSQGEVFVQRVTADGQVTPGWPIEGLQLTSIREDQGPPRIASDGAGGLYVGWEDLRTLPPGGMPELYGDIYLSRVTAGGALASGWAENGLPICTIPDHQGALRISADSFGGCLLIWVDYRDRSQGADYFAQRVLPDGQIAPGWPADGRRVSTAPYFQVHGVLCADGMGGAFIAWTNDEPQHSGVYAQHLTGTGDVALGWPETGVPLVSIFGGQQHPAITSVDGVNAVVAWEDFRDGGVDGIYAQRLVGDGPVPVQLSLVSAVADPDRAVLTWFAAGASNLNASVYRRTASTEWRRLGSPRVEGSDRLVFEDRDVTPGTRYAYRLGYATASGESFSAETWLEIPAALALALEGLRPNPAVGELVVAFTLPTTQRATLDLLDLAGRRVLGREVGELGPGRHLLRLEGGARLAAGVYWLRLQQGTEARVARGVVIR
jgi:hypothetical protein